jgi:hypothetical protein
VCVAGHPRDALAAGNGVKHLRLLALDNLSFRAREGARHEGAQRAGRHAGRRAGQQASGHEGPWHTGRQVCMRQHGHADAMGVQGEAQSNAPHYLGLLGVQVLRV